MSREQIQYLSLDQIQTVSQVRTHFDEEAIHGLAISLKELGQLQPIRVRKVGDTYIVVDGERRRRAAPKAGMTTIAVIIEEKDLNDGEVIQRQLIANCQREDLSAMEKARALQRLMETTGWNASQAAAKLGLSNATATRLLSLLSLPMALQQKVDQGQIAVSAAYELAKVSDADRQTELSQQVECGQLTRDMLTGTLKSERKEPSNATPPSRATAVLAPGRSITVTSNGLDLERFIQRIEDLLAKARKVRPQGVELSTFIKMLRDQAKVAI